MNRWVTKLSCSLLCSTTSFSVSSSIKLPVTKLTSLKVDQTIFEPAQFQLGHLSHSRNISSSVKKAQLNNYKNILTLSTPNRIFTSSLTRYLSSNRDTPKILTRENIYNIPNLLTLSRIASTPLLGYLIIDDQYPLALGLFIVSGITDLLDGQIARRYNLQTVVGSVLDPLADKILMTVLTVSLSWVNLIPFPLACLILGRDAGLILASFYYRYISLPPPKTFKRYWDFGIPSAEVHPTFISKANTFLQLALVGSTLLDAVIVFPYDYPILTGLQYIVAATTIGSGASYMFSKDAVKILTKPYLSKK